MTRKFSGLIDEFGFPYLNVDIINPATNETICDAKAIIDTGAAYSHMKQHVIDALSLTSSGQLTSKHLTDGDITSGIFEATIKFNKSIIIPPIKARVLHQEQYPSDLILGLDILKYCNFQYNCQHTFEFELFPEGEISHPNTKD